MQIDFLHQQPHPETNETACTWPKKDAILLNALCDEEACAISGAYVQGQFHVGVVFANENNVIHMFTGKHYRSLEKTTWSWQGSDAITALSLYEQKGHLFISALCGSLHIINQEAQSVAQIEAKPGANVFSHQACLYLSENGRITPLNERYEKQPATAWQVTAQTTAQDSYPLVRKDALVMEDRNTPGTIGGRFFSVGNKTYYTCADTFMRCGLRNIDTFLCEAGKDLHKLSRRYLVIPNGGAATIFPDDKGQLYAAMIGQTQYSAVAKKAAILPLETTAFGMVRPSPAYLTETIPTYDVAPIDVSSHIRDTFVYNAPDGNYYITGTTQRNNGTYWHGTDGIHIWRTGDFASKDDLGVVYDYADTPDSWQNGVSAARNTWAPEIVYHNNTYWITYTTAPGCGLLKSITGEITGPYQDMGRVVMRGIDSGFFKEGDDLYLVWQNGIIAKFNPMCNSFVHEPVLLMPEDNQEVGYEGACIINVNGKYVLYAAEWNGDERIDGTYDMMYSVSDNLYGPYCPRRVLVPHGGHGCLFYQKDGQLAFSMFGNDRTAPFRHGVGIGIIDVTQENGVLTLNVKGNR